MNKTVLFVSSNKTLSMFMAILVKRMGFEIVSAVNGREALQSIGESRPDAVILDSEMAEFDGLHKLEQIKQAEAGMPPVIMLAGKFTDEAERRCISAGASAVIYKPVMADELHRALEECMFMGAGSRRKHVRAKTDLRVTVFHEGRELSLTTESISAGGAYFRHDEPLEIGALVDVFMPAGDEEFLFVAGRVIYNQKPCRNRLGVCPGFAVKFVDLSESDTEALKQFVSALLTDGILGLDETGLPAAGDAEASARRSASDVYSAIRSHALNRAGRRKGVA